MVAYAVLSGVSIVGMRWSEEAAHVLIILRVLISVAHDEANGATSRFALKHTAQNLDLVGFVATSGNSALPRSATVQFALDERQVDVDAGRHAVDNATNGFAVALAKGGQREDVAKCIQGF